ncbi:MAG: hypothetical protein ACQESB_03465, partial [Elusimicrobiota bacterium]
YSYLVESQQQSQELMQQIMSLPSQMQAGFQPAPGTAKPGMQGYSQGKVEIPAPGDDMSGDEFRRRIFEALKKEYPGEYKRLIEEYFRSLSE